MVDYLNKEQIQYVTEQLGKRNNGERHQLIWILACNSALRISDVLTITLDKLNTKTLKMQKTQKNVALYIPEAIIEKCRDYAEKNGIGESDLLFGEKRRRLKTGYLNARIAPMSRQAIYAVWSEIGHEIGANIGCHTPRKSLARMLYDKTGDINIVAKFLGHTNTAATQNYIGLTNEIMTDVRMDIGLIGC